jgi:hypothetical protein
MLEKRCEKHGTKNPPSENRERMNILEKNYFFAAIAACAADRRAIGTRKGEQET